MDIREVCSSDVVTIEGALCTSTMIEDVEGGLEDFLAFSPLSYREYSVFTVFEFQFSSTKLLFVLDKTISLNGESLFDGLLTLEAAFSPIEGIGATVGFVSEDEDGELAFEEFSKDIKEDEKYFCQEECVAVKEDEYDNLTITSDEACRTYQEIFRMMVEGWMVTRTDALLVHPKNEEIIEEIIQNYYDPEDVIMEYLVNISKRRAFWSLNEDILKITILTTNTPYPSRKIRRIRACTHQRSRRKQAQYAVSNEDQYAVLEIYHVKILEDIKRGPYSKKPPIRRIQSLGYAVSNRLLNSKNRKLQNEF
ncbi:hypothetical protein Tco_0584261 [Tanacetum coccineum]